MKKILFALLLIASLNFALSASSPYGTLQMEDSTISCGDSLPCYAYFTFTPSQNLFLEQKANVDWARNNILTITLQDIYSEVNYYSPKVEVELKQLVSRQIYEKENCRNEVQDIKGIQKEVLACDFNLKSKLVQDYEKYTLFNEIKVLSKGSKYEFRLLVEKPKERDYKYTVCFLGACVDPLFGSEVEWVNFATNWTSVQGTNNIYYLYWNRSATTVGNMINLSATQWIAPTPSNTFWRLVNTTSNIIQWEGSNIGNINTFHAILAWKYNGTIANNFTVLGNMTCGVITGCGGDSVNLSFYRNATNGVFTSIQNITIVPLANTTINVTFTNLAPNEAIVMVVDPLGDDNNDAGEMYNMRIVGRSISTRFIDLPSPANATLVSQPVPLNFSVLNDPGQEFRCWRIIDGTLTLFGNVTGGFYNSSSLPLLSQGSHNLTIVCSDGQFNVTRERFFTLADIGAESLFPNPGYELNISTYNLQIAFSGNVTDINATLFLNGSVETVTKSSNGSFFDFSASKLIPIIYNNATYQIVSWNVSIRFSNGTLATANFTGNQSLFQSFAIVNVTADQTNVTEGSLITFTANILRLSPNGVFINPLLTFNGTNYTSNFISWTQLQSNAFAPLLNSTNSELLFYFQNLNFTDGINYRTISFPSFRNFTNGVNVTKVLLINCTTAPAGFVTIINFSVFDETNGLPLNLTTIEFSTNVSGINGLFSRNYSFLMNTSGGNSVGICMSPGGLTVQLDAIATYSKTGYSTRNWFSFGNFSNVTSNFSLYLLPTALSSQVIIFVVDENGNPVPDVIIKAQRFFVSMGAYIDVAILKSDFEGKDTTFLQVESVYYKFVLSRNGTVVAQFSPAVIVCPSGSICPPYPLTLPISTLGSASFYKRFGKVTVACSANNNTGVLSCLVDSNDNSVVTSNLRVNQWGATNFTQEVCNTNCTASSCTLICSLGNVTGNRYEYFLYVTDPSGNFFLADYGLLDFSQAMFAWDVGMAVFIMLLLVGTLFFAGREHPGIAMGLSAVGIIAGFMLGLLPVALGSLIGFLIVIGIIMFKTPRGI